MAIISEIKENIPQNVKTTYICGSIKVVDSFINISKNTQSPFLINKTKFANNWYEIIVNNLYVSCDKCSIIRIA